LKVPDLNTSEQNGVAERKNCSLVESARCMLINSGLSESFWAEAIAYANDIGNAAPTKALDKISSNELLTGIKPSVSCFKVFGCRAMALIQGDHLTKFAPRTKELVYLGPENNTTGYKLWNPLTRKIVHNRNVKFFEQKIPSPVLVPEQPIVNSG